MTRILTVLSVCLFVGLALAGCTSTNNNGGTTPTGTTPTSSGGSVSFVSSSTPLAPTVGQAVTFTASPSGQSANIDAAQWDFGDGSNGTGATTTHTYAAPGDYVARVTVTSGSATATNDANLLYIRVAGADLDLSKATASNTPPVAQLVGDHQVVKPGDTVSFVVSGSYGWTANANYNPNSTASAANPPISPDAKGITQYSLDFGDGSAPATGNDTAAPVNHTYANAGTYAAKLTVTSSSGNGTGYFTIVVLANAPSTQTSPNKDTFVTATIPGPSSVDPGYEYDASSGELVQQVYDTLVGYDRDNINKVIPILASDVPSASNGGISSDGLTYTFHIRSGVKFHDGTLLDADAVKFSFDRFILMRDPNSAAGVVAPVIKGAAEYLASGGTAADRQTYLAAGGITVSDPMTVVFHLPKPDPSVFPRLAFNAASVVSPTAVKAAHPERQPLWGSAQTADGLPPVGVTRDPWMDLHEVGTGPYTIRAWLPNDRVIFDAFPGYWGAAQFPNMPKTVIIQYVGDLNTRILLLKSGQADEIYVNGRDMAQVRPQIESISNIVPAQSLVVRQFALNFNIDPSSGECPKGNDGTADCKFFDDIHMRRAFSYAYDYDSFVNNVMHGTVIRAKGAIPKGMPGYDPNLAGFSLDMDKAKAELAASNHPDGFTIDVFYNTGNTGRQGALELLKRQLESLGPNIHVNVQNLDFNALTSKEQQHQIPLAAVAWSPDYIATDDYVVPYYDSSGYFPASFGYHNDSLDAQIQAALKETDTAKQAQDYADIEKAAVQDVPYVFLSQDSLFHVERSWVHGYYYNPTDAGIPEVGQYKYMSKA